MKATIEEMEKCEDEEEFGCSSKRKDEILEKASKVQEDNDAAMTDKKKREEMMKKFQGGEKGSDGKDKAPMSVKLPDGCTSKTDCDWICTKMASAKGGVDMDKVDMRDQESMDGTTKYTKTRRRVLSGGDVTVGNSVATNDNDGYEADSDENNEGLDSSFEENVDSSVDSDSSSGRMFTNSWTVGLSLVAMMAAMLHRN